MGNKPRFLSNILNFDRVTNSTTYVPQIDGLRFLALLPVLFWHSGLRGLRFFGSSQKITVSDNDLMLPHGHIGVYLFFFISGYIIAFPYFNRGTPNVRAFYIRRITRLHPPYIVSILFCFAALALAGHHISNAPSFSHNKDISLFSSFTASLFYLHGLIFNAPPKLDPPAWSLEIEIQFYAIVPIIFWLLSKMKFRSTKAILLLSIIFGLLSMLGNLFWGPYGWQNRTIFGYLYLFLLGVAFSYYATRFNPFAMEKKKSFDIGFIIGVTLWISSGFLEKFSTSPGQYICLYILQFMSVILIYLGAARGAIFSKVMSWPPLCALGGMCFSIYLIHVPLMQVTSQILFHYVHPTASWAAICLSFACLIPTSILAGAIFYKLVEQPCMDPHWPQKIANFFSNQLRTAQRLDIE